MALEVVSPQSWARQNLDQPLHERICHGCAVSISSQTQLLNADCLPRGQAHALQNLQQHVSYILQRGADQDRWQR
jgi:hypothetical protein